MTWIDAPVYVDVTTEEKQLINLEDYKFIQPFNEGVQTKLIAKAGSASDIILNVAYTTLAMQVRSFTGGADFSGNAL